MMTRTNLDWTKRLSTLAVLSTVVVPLVGDATAQADPPDHAPAWGYRDDRQNRNRPPGYRDRDIYDDDIYDDDVYDDDYAEHGTRVRGVVTRELAGDQFELRAENGQIYRVVFDRSAWDRFSVGDRVEVLGHSHRDIFIADDIRPLDGDIGSGDFGRVNFPGTIVAVESAYRIVVRGDNGRIYTVTTQSRLSTAFNVGDRVRVNGIASNGIITAETVTLLQDNSDTTGGYGRVNFPGTIVALESAYRVVVRGDNGRNYTVTTRARLSRDFSIGDRVRVIGIASNGAITAETVTMLQDTNNSPSSAANFRGTVLRVERFANLRHLEVRGDNGRIYQVRYSGSNRFSVNDRVRVIGTSRNGYIVASSVSRL